MPVSVPGPTVDVDELVTTHLALVGHLAREAASRLPRHLDTDDLIGAGALALVQAAHSFDPEQGVPFPRFASTRVRGAMIDQMRQRDWATRSVRSRARALNAVSEDLTRALQRTPTEGELAAASGMSTEEIRQVLHSTDRATLLSLDPIAADDEGLGAGLPDRAPRPDEALIAAERMGYLRDAIAELPERTRARRGGLLPAEPAVDRTRRGAAGHPVPRLPAARRGTGSVARGAVPSPQ